ncbi:MAG: DUF4249 domain-containing protein [Bacteroidales bacterium]|nr:DUF4249 domain-containing protein [Bacteroidales bacterium]
MKKIYMILSAVLCLAACDNPLEYKPADKNDELIVNALMDASETSHKVSLAISCTEKVRPVQRAELRCFVNGKRVATTRQLLDNSELGDSGNWGAKTRWLCFNASFKSGDLVRIEVQADGKFSASCEQVVPAAPNLDSAEASLEKKEGDEYPRKYFFEIKLKDSADQVDYYRLCMRNHVVSTYYDREGNVISKETFRREIPMEIDNDPILNEGHIGGSGGFDFELGSPNEFGAFYDSLFDGKTATLRPAIDRAFLASFDYQMPEHTYSVQLDFYVDVVLLKIPKRYYHYLLAMNLLRGGSDDLALEDIQIPDNIDGGIGFVGLSSSSVETVFLESNSFVVNLY